MTGIPHSLDKALANQNMMFDEFDSLSGRVGSIRAVGFSHQGPDHRQNNDFLKIRVQLLEWHRFLFFSSFQEKTKRVGRWIQRASFSQFHTAPPLQHSEATQHSLFFVKNNRLFGMSHAPLSFSLWRLVSMLLDHNAVFQPVHQFNQSNIPLSYTGALLTSEHCYHLFLSLYFFWN